MFIQPTIIVPILLIVLITLVFIGIVVLIVKKMKERWKRIRISVEKLKKLSEKSKVKLK
jgi:DMSO/TMAO reductase YedYZ heme-binding membrane subunit